MDVCRPLPGDTIEELMRPDTPRRITTGLGAGGSLAGMGLAAPSRTAWVLYREYSDDGPLAVFLTVEAKQSAEKLLALTDAEKRFVLTEVPVHG